MSEPPARTPDGRHLVIGGRRWRATDPAIPEQRREELTRILMAWRREVRRTKGTDRERAARAGVQAAKVALGERGDPWWGADRRAAARPLERRRAGTDRARTLTDRRAVS
ncbi:hypothetical protein [Nocardioides sp. TF02-7]|uniref:hypothetical protein n=1 Tax=Nocardioides sp. TF02-7 TaxID=2917724 RepID=UPI001F0562CE|nr:hypothetical protein [Nocardioides sp. TF02-7]UMG91883.1 hypothetical protein MF408_17910 [Nocardioides sp. TF02-7]